MYYRLFLDVETCSVLSCSVCENEYNVLCTSSYRRVDGEQFCCMTVDKLSAFTILRQASYPFTEIRAFANTQILKYRYS